MWVCGFADVNNMVQHKRRGGETFVHAMYVICNLHVIRLGSEANHMCVLRLDTISSSQQPVNRNLLYQRKITVVEMTSNKANMVILKVFWCIQHNPHFMDETL